jgi:hypothetical protein
MAVGRTGRLGRVVDIRAVDADDPAAEYLAKRVGMDLAGYLAKTQAERVITGSRFRPIRKSRNWYPGGQKKAEAVVRGRWTADRPTIEAEDWHICRIDDKGRVRVIRQPKAAAAVPVAALNARRGLVPESGPVFLEAA